MIEVLTAIGVLASFIFLALVLFLAVLAIIEGNNLSALILTVSILLIIGSTVSMYSDYKKLADAPRLNQVQSFRN